MEERLYKLKTLVICLSNRKAAITTLFLLLFQFTIIAQSQFTGMNARWDDSSREWIIYGFSDDEAQTETEGDLRLKWPLKNSWDEWTLEYNGDYTNIRLKWNNNPGHWEVRTQDGEIISIKTKWRNDFTEWVIESNSTKLKWISEFRDNMSSWYFEDKALGYMTMQTAYTGDPRDWDIIDEAPEVSNGMKIAAMFITVYLTNPKE